MVKTRECFSLVVALALVLSLGIVAVSMAGTAGASAYGCFSELYYEATNPHDTVSGNAHVLVKHGHWYFTDGDSIDASTPLSWQRSWGFEIIGPTVDLTNPYIKLTSDLPFVGFNPEPTVIGPSAVQWTTEAIPTGTQFIGHAHEGVDTFPPGCSLSRAVSPQYLVGEITLQTITATVTLEEVNPDWNYLSISIGFVPFAFGHEQAVTSVYDSGASTVGPWEFQGDVGDRSVAWGANPLEVETGKSYQLEATFETTRNPELLSAPIYKPKVTAVFVRLVDQPPVSGCSTTVDCDDVSVEFGADNEVTWKPLILDLEMSANLEEVYLTSIKQEATEPGEYVVDAKAEADTEVIKSGSGTPTATIAKYSSNPGTCLSGDVGKYIDVHIDDATDVTEIEIRLYYTDGEIVGLDESSLRLHWWDGSDWAECSDTGVNMTEDYMWAKIRNDTVPSLNELTGTPFATAGEWDPWAYDENQDGIIQKMEAIHAIQDYFSQEITKAQAIEVIMLYFG